MALDVKEFRFLGFMIAFDNKTVRFPGEMGEKPKNSLPSPGQLPGGKNFWGGRCPPCPPPESGPGGTPTGCLRKLKTGREENTDSNNELKRTGCRVFPLN